MSFDETVDVLIAGTGAAGCSAALGALHCGAQKVLLCEKARSLVGGTTNLAGGGWLWCPNNRFLAALGVRQPPEDILSLLSALAYPHSPPDPGDLALMQVFAREWPAVIEAMQQAGYIRLQTVQVRDPVEDAALVEALLRRKLAAAPERCREMGLTPSVINHLKQFIPSYCAEHPLDLCPSGKVLAPDGGTTSSLLEAAVEAFAGRAEIRMHCRVVDLVFNGQNEVMGAVVAQGADGAVRRIRATRGVVFGSGGFSWNKELVERHLRAPIFGSCAALTNTGDFQGMCARHGIELSGMDQAWLKQVVLPPSGDRWPGTFFLNADSFMVVNKHGRRFSNEKHFYQQRGMEMYENQADNRVVFFVHDDRSDHLYKGPIISWGGPIPMDDCDQDCTVTASSVPELCQKLRAMTQSIVPDFQFAENFQENLQREVEKFNRFAKNGKDEDFNRGENVAQVCWHPVRKQNEYPNKTMHPIDTTKLRVFAMGLSTLDTKGGPRINGNGQVLRKGSEVVKGLYGAGNCIRSFSNDSYPASGVTIASAMLFGFKSGMHCMNPNHKL